MGFHTGTLAGADGDEEQVPVTVPIDWSRYVGVPFVEGRSDRAGADCWGLVRLIYREILDVTLDAYSDISPRELRRVAMAMRDGSTISPLWASVSADELRPLDVCLMRVQSSSLVAHVGVMVDSDRMLHVEQSTASVIVPLDHPLYRCRIARFARYVGEPRH